MSRALPENLRGKKIALVHDFLVYPGGAEWVLQMLADMFPDAPIYTMLYDEKKMRGAFAGREVHTSFLQKFPRFMRRRHRWLLPFLPTAPETLDLRDFDVVISSSGAWSKALVTRLDTVHIAYIHSPMRYVWDKNNASIKELGVVKRAFLSYLRIWDYQAAQRPDHLIANSVYTQQRIKKYYRRDADVVYPGTSEQVVSDHERTYFLVVSRLSGYKNTGLAIDVCNKLALPLKVVGEGREMDAYKKLAGPTVEICGWQSEERVQELYDGARAFFFPCVDDFGLTIVESLAHSVPVIALRRGGAVEILDEGVTGEFFDVAEMEVCADAVRRFLAKEGNYDVAAMHTTAEKFSRDNFTKNLLTAIEKIDIV